MLWVFDHQKYCNAEIDFKRQNLTSTYVKFWGLKNKNDSVIIFGYEILHVLNIIRYVGPTPELTTSDSQ